MRNRFVIQKFLTLFLLLTICGSIQKQNVVNAATQSNGSQPFAIVELFTSEGCSSCPPADAFMAELTSIAKKNNHRVFTLGMHVDYWDYIGWKDPFSQNQFTQRQRQYGQALQTSTIYTPQMVINGRHEFGGYREDLAHLYIKQALNSIPKTNVQLQITSQTNDQVITSYRVTAPSQNDVLVIALVEKDLISKVLKGENTGKTLHHTNVVRVLKYIPLDTVEGNITLPIPPFVDQSKSSIIAFTQNPHTMTITGANSIDLPSVENF